MEPSEELDVLKRKLSEAEARISSRLLKSAKEVIPAEQYIALKERFEANGSYDLLEMERQIADAAKLLASCLYDLYEAVKSYRESKHRFDNIMEGNIESTENDAQHAHNEMIMYREKMFSLVSEFEIKEDAIRNSD